MALWVLSLFVLTVPLHGKIWSCLRQFSFHFHFFVWQTKLCTLVKIRSQSAPMEWGPKKHSHHDMALFPLVLYNCTNSSCPHDLLVHTHNTKSWNCLLTVRAVNLNMLHLFEDSIHSWVQFLWHDQGLFRQKIHMHSTFSIMFFYQDIKTVK